MPLETLFGTGSITAQDIVEAAEVAEETPFYFYDAPFIIGRCQEINKLKEGHNFLPRFAMKANSNKAILQLIHQQGFGIDASSLNEARRAKMAGIPYSAIMLTSQEVPEGKDRRDLEKMMKKGLKYNACSVRQLELIADYVARKKIPVSIRVHPGEGGSGESITRDTANPYSCFGIHISEFKSALEYASKRGVIVDHVHEHIGSGGNPEKWRSAIDRLTSIIEEHQNYLTHLQSINFGGGLKQGRMPDEQSADAAELCTYALDKVKSFAERCFGRNLRVEIEPGTYMVAMAGSLVTRIIDKKSTGKEGFNFIVSDGGMEVNSRPLYYGSRHPFAVVSSYGELVSSECDLSTVPKDSLWIPVGRCCESGDSQSLDSSGNAVPRRMATPQIGNYFVIGGCGAYCSTMTPFNYNSHTRAPEVLKRASGEMQLIRESQSLTDVVKGERSL